jgi:hypothetical protein
MASVIRGFYGDEKGGMVHVSGSVGGSCVIGHLVPLSECPNYKSARIRFDAGGLTYLGDVAEDICRYIEKSHSFLTKSWLRGDIDRVLKEDRGLNEENKESWLLSLCSSLGLGRRDCRG